jgi:ubiquinone/menaquinone biosynthesis C-methylase UbiE
MLARGLAAARELIMRRRAAAPEAPIAYLLRQSRSAYEAVWNALADTEERAKLNVAGFTDEAAYLATGEATRRVLEASVGIGPGDDVFEIGCGVGRVGLALSPACRRWIGGDVSSRMLAHAARRLQTCANVSFVKLSGFDLAPVASASLDVVYCTVVFMHLDEWDRFNYVREAHRVLRPGGRVYVDNFDLGSDEGWAIFEDCARIAPHLRLPHISRASTGQELVTFLERARFRSVQVEHSEGWVRAWGSK